MILLIFVKIFIYLNIIKIYTKFVNLQYKLKLFQSFLYILINVESEPNSLNASNA